MSDLKVKLFSNQKAIADDFINYVGDKFNFDYQWQSLNEENIKETTPHFSIFLLNLQNANNVWLKNQVKRLIEFGAHDQSMYFLLVDKETISKKNEIELVKSDLFSQLSKIITNPKIDLISLQAIKAFYKKEERFLYFDSSLEEYRTIKQILLGNNDDLQNFHDYHGKENVSIRLQFWAENNYLPLWKRENEKIILSYNVPEIILEEIIQYDNVYLLKIQTLDDFLLLSQDHQVVSLQYVINQEVSQDLNENTLYIGNNNEDSDIHYFDETIYRLKRLPNEHLRQKDELVFVDEKGYPKPKTRVKDWSKEIDRVSGITRIIEDIKGMLA